ncbi:FAD-binding protein [Kutzneria buriramensis]|uniref:FAD/FMN-containing dehydrogenase n=1 Tax=Kutzneria buriramensis TaxID=1045776 RepID=A0A3E0GUR1_9PSEU|nr:FAD-binding protein [Kutzneria buriramensis]REH28631.1 FAD/FMN-containing dehydrogenase [Kutzneria buriramensis]
MAPLLAGTEKLMLTGRLRDDDATKAKAGMDFGGIVDRRPAAVVEPCDADDIAEIVRFATDRGIRVSARGRGHSTHGQSLVDGGIVIDMSALAAVHRVELGYAVVDAGATWRTVLEATLPRGLTPPVLTDFLDLSVGGTLSLGGIGGTSHRYGAQTDNVIALEVVTGAGERLTCSRASNAELFRAVLAGLGQCAIVTQATVALVPAPTHVRRRIVAYPDAVSLNAAQRTLVEDRRCDYVEGLIVQDGQGGWLHNLEAVSFAADADVVVGDGVVLETMTMSYFDFVNRLGDEETFLSGLMHKVQPRPWCTVYVPGDDVDAVVDASLARPQSEVGSLGMFLVYPIPRSALSTPLLRVPDDETMFQFSVFRYAEPADAAAVKSMLAANRDMYAQAQAVGGTLYPFASVVLDRDGWEAHWGNQWEMLRSAKTVYDPKGVLGSGQGIF